MMSFVQFLLLCYEFVFYQKQNVRAFVINLGVTITAVAFESQPEINEFVEKLFFRDENITWNKHIELVENKISKNIGILYKASHYLDKKSLKNIHFSFIHNYVNYCNIAWASTSRTKLDKILKKQKHAVRIIYNKDEFTHSKPLVRDMNALNVYQINIFQV